MLFLLYASVETMACAFVQSTFTATISFFIHSLNVKPYIATYVLTNVPQ